MGFSSNPQFPVLLQQAGFRNVIMKKLAALDCDYSVMPHFCYLLHSPTIKNCQACYIGFTDNPRRRLRCHNGELKNGAHHTSKYRPWDHVCIVSGFPNRIVALQFEWQWQNPKKSRIIKNRQSILNTKTIRGYRMSLKVLNSLLETALWKRLNLVIHFIDPQILLFFQSLSINSKTPDNQQLKKCVLNCHAELDVMHKPLDDVTEEDDMESNLNNPVCFICKKSRYCDMPHTTIAIGDDDIQTVNGSSNEKVITDKRHRMWYCPRPSCRASCHLYCSATSLNGCTLGPRKKIVSSSSSINNDYNTVASSSRESEIYNDDISSRDNINMTQSGQQSSLIPLRGICTACGESSDWVDIVVGMELHYKDKGPKKKTKKRKVSKKGGKDNSGKIHIDDDIQEEEEDDFNNDNMVLTQCNRSSRTKYISDSDDDLEEEGNIMYIGDSSDDDDDVFIMTQSQSHQQRLSNKDKTVKKDSSEEEVDNNEDEEDLVSLIKRKNEVLEVFDSDDELEPDGKRINSWMR